MTARATRNPASAQQAPPYPDWIVEAIAGLPPIARISEVAGVIRVSRTTIWRLVANGRLKAVNGGAESGPKPLLIPRAEVARYLQSLESGTSWQRDARRAGSK